MKMLNGAASSDSQKCGDPLMPNIKEPLKYQLSAYPNIKVGKEI
jgi:hypothetical protein